MQVFEGRGDRIGRRFSGLTVLVPPFPPFHPKDRINAGSGETSVISARIAKNRPFPKPWDDSDPPSTGVDEDDPSFIQVDTPPRQRFY
ncbi:hypothetical protein Airi02_038670 [Actinoallomurus iriomotensis]|uniref:Uncharacterized protein n=1 Tax=Actinoallomurus iriomotensis TaxID=478107 RepID=A0A9W6S2B7_9ACTN|nr:hypothetical protein Airi02_038670 [Actinoallomurus iriomotensis]